MRRNPEGMLQFTLIYSIFVYASSILIPTSTLNAFKSIDKLQSASA